ncbi:MAG: hypothetical protein RLZ57_1038, partial [Actinomycetota bacterium]
LTIFMGFDNQLAIFGEDTYTSFSGAILSVTGDWKKCKNNY